VSLDPASQREFQRKVEDRCVELNYIRRAAEGIEFGRRHPDSPELLRIIARPEKLSIEESFRPELSLVVKEIDEIVKAARDTLNPRVLAGVRVCVRKQASAPGGDARVFLGDRVLCLPEERKGAFGRPIHTVGLKFFMPPYHLVGGTGAGTQEPDGVEVRIESLNEDISDLYLECHRYFLAPMDPSRFTSLQPLVERTNDFLEQQVAQFLQVSDPEAGGSNG
jgi:hypothetical protein